MSAYRLHADAEGHVCGGVCIDSSRSSESWKMTGFPVKSPEACGFVVAWPNGERWEHQCYVGAIDHPAEMERAA